MRKILLYVLFISFGISSSFAQSSNKLLLNNGSVKFISDATLENIQASSTKLKGLLLTNERTFAFTVDINSFNGFNGSIQREHFNENYMESDTYPRASFSGKIVEDVNFLKDGVYELRAKGKLNIHGVEKERTIKIQMETKNGRINVNAKFNVLLEDHNISIPSVVNQKIAEEVVVEVKAQFNINE